MADKKLSFESGVVTYNINDKCEVSFNPTDTTFVEKLFSAFEDLDNKQDTYKTTIESMSDKREIFEFAKDRDEEMRAVIDGLFGVPVCDALFGSMNVYSLAGGLPVWCNFLLAVVDEIDDTYVKEQKASNSRIAKYTAKYRKYQK